MKEVKALIPSQTLVILTMTQNTEPNSLYQVIKSKYVYKNQPSRDRIT